MAKAESAIKYSEHEKQASARDAFETRLRAGVKAIFNSEMLAEMAALHITGVTPPAVAVDSQGRPLVGGTFKLAFEEGFAPVKAARASGNGGGSRTSGPLTITAGPRHLGQYPSPAAAWKVVNPGVAGSNVGNIERWLTNHGYTFTRS